MFTRDRHSTRVNKNAGSVQLARPSVRIRLGFVARTNAHLFFRVRPLDSADIKSASLSPLKSALTEKRGVGQADATIHPDRKLVFY